MNDLMSTDQDVAADVPDASTRETAQFVAEARKTQDALEWLAFGTGWIGGILAVVLMIAGFANLGGGSPYADHSTSASALFTWMAVAIGYTILSWAILKLGSLVAGHIALKNTA